LNQLAAEFGVQLVGGDTVKGPLNISIQILGVVEADGWLTRSGARAGDLIMVSGIPGEAAGGLQLLLQASITADETQRRHLLQRFYRPTPRVQLGRAIRGIATAAMDVSDGLLTDLTKLCAASGVGAVLHLNALPMSVALNTVYGAHAAQQHALFGGDDYELLFTVPRQRLSQLQDASNLAGVVCTHIGEVTTEPQVQCLLHGSPVTVQGTGFDHFSESR
jgi:thiamine-monophosphate kinase